MSDDNYLQSAPANNDDLSDEDSQQLYLPNGTHPHLAIWGTPGTGKTVYLAALFKAFTASKHDQSLRGWKLMPRGTRSQSSDDWLNIYNDMMDTHVFPPATQEGSHSFPSFSLLDEHNNVIFNFTFIDASGEMYLDPDTYAKNFGLKVHPYDYLRQCEGILLLLDPVQVLEGRGEGFRSITNMLIALSKDTQGNPSPINKPMALCITKCDHPECRVAFANPEAFASETFGRNLIDLTSTFLANAEWFACSALGHDTSKADEPMNMIRRWDGRVGIRDSKRIKPLNIAEPILWLADKMSNSNLNHTSSN